MESGGGEGLSELLSSLVGRGVFGAGHYTGLRLDESVDTGVVQYSSEVSFLKLRLRVDTRETRTVPIVVKSQIPSKCRPRRDTASMFKNEVEMYSRILPFINPSIERPYPKLYYGSATGGEGDILIIENLKYSGFAANKEKLFLDFNHISVAIRRLAELHSWSIIKKTREQKLFYELVGKLEKVVRVRGDEDFDFDKMNYLSLKRGIDPLLKSGKDTKALQDFLKVAKDINKMYMVVQKSVEPFGVVLHGDFCKNNLFFKYDSKGKPIDCSYFDLQLSKYGSLAVDLSFFLYMHTTAESRASQWDIYLKIYWNSLKEHIPVEIELPNYSEFEKHFATKALYGYLVSSYCLPSLLEERGLTDTEFAALTAQDKLQRFVQSAGTTGQQLLTQIVSHMLERQYIQTFLRYYDIESKKLRDCK